MRIDPETTAPHPLLTTGTIGQLVRLAAEALVVGVLVSLVLGLAAFVVASTAHTRDFTAPRSGEMRFEQGGGEAPVRVPSLALDVEIDVSGIVARTRDTQRFVNPGNEWREGFHLFPVPETAAVDHLDIKSASGGFQDRSAGAARRDTTASRVACGV